MSPLKLRNAPALRTKPLGLTTRVSGHFAISLFAAVLVAAIGSSAGTARGVQPNVSITTLPTTTLIHPFETVGDPNRVAPFDDNIVSVGDYNSFEFNDGYVDVVGTVLGTPAPADQVVQLTATISTGMTDLIQF